VVTKKLTTKEIQKIKIDPKALPNHVSVIMDGNGRWAQDRSLPRTEGHLQGEQALFECVEAAIELGIPWLTAYGFSTENWKRPKEEVRFLINFNKETIRKRRDELHERNVRIQFIGRENWRIPKTLLKDMDNARDLTKDNTGLTFTVAFNYGGRAEIVDAIQCMIKDKLDPSKITEKQITKYLYNPEMPDPDLVIRTSGEQRLSNFLLWQSAYSEFLFLNEMWPDFNKRSFHKAIREYQNRARRFGDL
jgi:undecaprenyl diphosphate synthase|tara:strand:- start:65176 stop:65919 length:744 start_codon:yes stop_codon:yes gene_type:complete